MRVVDLEQIVEIHSTKVSALTEENKKLQHKTAMLEKLKDVLLDALEIKEPAAAAAAGGKRARVEEGEAAAAEGK